MYARPYIHYRTLKTWCGKLPKVRRKHRITPPPHHLVYIYEGAAGVRGSVISAARKVR